MLGGEHPLSRLSSHVKTDVRKADEIMWPSRVARVLGYGILKDKVGGPAHAARRTRATPDTRQSLRSRSQKAQCEGRPKSENNREYRVSDKHKENKYLSLYRRAFYKH